MYDPLLESSAATVEQPRVVTTVTGPLGPQKDLRSFLRYLEEHHPDELIRVNKKEVDPTWEVAAVMFENVKDSRMPVLTNMVASRVRLGATFETTVENSMWEYARRETERIK